ncbi:MAG: endonuclease III [Nitrospirota bacterium]|nr:endonuclease III [Nitrospirota bacterium]
MASAKQTGKAGRKKAAPVAEVLRVLAELYPDAECALTYRNPYELLIATILSAQCTDARVNMVTPALFEKFPTPEAMAAADLDDIVELVRSTGFFNNKARNILACCRDIVTRHGGEVPGTLDDLVKLAGVGRKTANVVLGNAFGVPGITVDTHLGRVSRRLGLTRNEDPVKVEFDLMKKIPKDQWTLFSHRVIHHGRALCAARKPKCEVCPLSGVCPAA